ncbi:MAG TPA: hypothetical protein VGP73_22315 [Thermoanaerobaculia bacterium]
MLKKRIVVTTIALGFCLPALSSAAPLSWVPRTDLLPSLSRLWDLLPGTHHGAAAHPARDQRKNGPGMDPEGVTVTSPAPGGQTTDPTATGS